uniref:Factor X activator light chain 2 n=1 Tax=Daboia russelii TaxID=8707 RepID=T1P647_DABRR|nr:factor X activator light chain 2 [Daboia russelii]AFE61611.1 factor X activator light chain 2 [Daboia russelii]
MGRFISVSFGLLVVFLSLSGTGAGLDCPPDSSLYRYFCYRVFKEHKTWEAAERFCMEHPNNGHLVSIESMEEAEFVAKLLSNTTGKFITHFWIGLMIKDKEQECSSEWSDGSSVSYDKLGKEEFRKCFVLEKESGYRMWFNRNCEERYVFVCKVPPEC